MTTNEHIFTEVVFILSNNKNIRSGINNITTHVNDLMTSLIASLRQIIVSLRYLKAPWSDSNIIFTLFNMFLRYGMEVLMDRHVSKRNRQSILRYEYSILRNLSLLLMHNKPTKIHLFATLRCVNNVYLCINLSMKDMDKPDKYDVNVLKHLKMKKTSSWVWSFYLF